MIAVWPGAMMGDATPKEFEEWFYKHVGFTPVKFIAEIKVMLEEPHFGYEGNSVIVFGVHEEYTKNLSIRRLSMGIYYLHHLVESGDGHVYPQEILDLIK